MQYGFHFLVSVFQFGHSVIGFMFHVHTCLSPLEQRKQQDHY
jgi:hypothetical protein